MPIQILFSGIICDIFMSKILWGGGGGGGGLIIMLYNVLAMYIITKKKSFLIRTDDQI